MSSAEKQLGRTKNLYVSGNNFQGKNVTEVYMIQFILFKQGRIINRHTGLHRFLDRNEKCKTWVVSRERKQELWNKWNICVDILCALSFVLPLCVLCFHKNIALVPRPHCLTLPVCLLKLCTNTAWFWAKILCHRHLQYFSTC